MNKIAFVCCMLLLPIPSMPANARDTPPDHYESVGVCPFECCTYREWTAQEAIPVHAARSDGSPVLFQLQRNEKLDGVTGVVVAEHPAPVTIDRPVRDGYVDGSKAPQLSLRPGDVVYMLTPLGEGFYRFWYHGKVYRSGIELTAMPGTDAKDMDLIWWKQVRNKTGQIGWTRSNAFGNADDCA